MSCTRREETVYDNRLGYCNHDLKLRINLQSKELICFSIELYKKK